GCTVVGTLGAGLQRPSGRGDDHLHGSHAQSLLSAPMVAGEHVAHGIGPACITHEAHCRATAREAAVSILVLAETGSGRGDPDIGNQMELMTHIPGITVDHY